MKKLVPWIGGAVIGVLFSGIVAGILIVGSALADQRDPAYQMIAVSWGTPVETPELWLYQIQVIATDDDKDGVLEVRARGGIGASMYYHDFGELGKAANHGEAVRKFGDIAWKSDQVTIGGVEGVKGSVSRNRSGKASIEKTQCPPPPDHPVPAISQKLTTRRLISWTVFIGAGAAILWIMLSFLVYLPIDDSKVYPELSPSEIGSGPILWMMVRNITNDEMMRGQAGAPTNRITISAKGDDSQILLREGGEKHSVPQVLDFCLIPVLIAMESFITTDDVAIGINDFSFGEFSLFLLSRKTMAHASA